MIETLPYDSLERLSKQPLPVPEAQLAEWLGEWLEQQQERITDPAFAAAFEPVYPHYAAPPEAYLQRQLESPAGRALAGIRFFNLDPQAPFVELLAWDGPTPTSWLPLIEREWSAFKPFAVRVLHEGPPAGDDVRLDMSLHGARCSDMQPAAPDSALELAPVTDPAAALALIDAVHAQVRQRQPALGRQITALGAEGLDWCLAQGKALFITVGGATAGLIACAPDQVDFLKGQVIFEEVVSPQFQGRGLAAQAQCALAELLCAEDPDSLLLGTIAHNNHASRRSAERAGRPALLNYWFLGLPPTPSSSRA